MLYKDQVGCIYWHTGRSKLVFAACINLPYKDKVGCILKLISRSKIFFSLSFRCDRPTANHSINLFVCLFCCFTSQVNSYGHSGEILNKLKSRGFLASGLSTYDFSTLYTTLPHNLIKEKLTELIEQTFNREGSLYLACNDKNAFFTSEQPKRYKLWSCQKIV